MRGAMAKTVLAVLVCGTAYGQATDTSLQFEVASVKPTPPRKEGEPYGTVGCRGGPGSKDPSRYICTRSTVSLMALQAYGLKIYQLRPPYSQDAIGYNVEAKVPPGATAEQVKVMLQNLLTERFKMAFHYEKTETPGYALVVAKSGLKMAESATEPRPAPADGTPPAARGPVKDADGFVYIPPPRDSMAVSTENGLRRWVGNTVPMDRLATLLGTLVGRPVINSTGLTGKYDFSLTFSVDTLGGGGLAAAPPSASDGAQVPPADGGVTVFAASEKQLGLRLEARKIPFDAFVIDHVDKTPVEN